MKRESWERYYPNLYKLLEFLATDNGFKVKKELPVIPGMALIETEASKLNGEQLENLAIGELEEIRMMVEEYGLAKLEDWLNKVFDGEFHTAYFN